MKNIGELKKTCLNLTQITKKVPSLIRHINLNLGQNVSKEEILFNKFHFKYQNKP